MSEKSSIRLYVSEPLAPRQTLTLSQNQSHYLANVMRCKAGDSVALFNGSAGEMAAEVTAVSKKSVQVNVTRQLKPQKASPDLWLAFAPIKNKTELVVEKATELGVSKLLPVFTQHAVVKSVNMEKLTAHAIEAAEQCERMDVPVIEPRNNLAAMLGSWPKQRTLFYGDESGTGQPIKTLLTSLKPGSYALLIGPEGGFSQAEHQLLQAAPFVKPFGMGPRILRADTAAVAALAYMQAWLGDWEEKPHFAAAF